MKIVMKKSKKPFRRPRYYGVIVGSNGEPMWTTELVFNKGDLKQTIQQTKSGTLMAEVIDETGE